MNPTRLCLVAAALLLASSARAQEPPDRLAQWLAAIKTHEPGNPGKGALDIAQWSGFELEEVIIDAKRYARSLDKSRQDEANDLLLRGAALHADIAHLMPHDMTRRSMRQQRIFIVRDGREQGTRYVSIHWELGRSLLDGVEPSPALHPGVLAWYQQTSRDILGLLSLSEASVHLPRARRIFPSDPVLLFASGILHERFSSAPLQAAADAVVSENGGLTSISSARAELVQAERFFRETLALQPDHLEARVRHGRVLGELGRHAQAAEALRMAIQGGATGEFLYLAELFLGKQEDAVGKREHARASFERAAALFPRAQSPRLALSQLSRRTGDREGAQRELRALAELPADENQREDPWWDYYNVR